MQLIPTPKYSHHYGEDRSNFRTYQAFAWNDIFGIPHFTSEAWVWPVRWGCVASYTPPGVTWPGPQPTLTTHLH